MSEKLRGLDVAKTLLTLEPSDRVYGLICILVFLAIVVGVAWQTALFVGSVLAVGHPLVRLLNAKAAFQRSRNQAGAKWEERSRTVVEKHVGNRHSEVPSQLKPSSEANE